MASIGPTQLALLTSATPEPEREADSLGGGSIVVRRLYAPQAGLTDQVLGGPSLLACRLPLLAELDLSGNELTQLPAGMGQLSGLRKLYLHNCRLASLPDDLVGAGCCGDLREIWLEHNRLTSLPVDWSGARRLVSLHCGWNQLTSLPVDFCTSLPRLVELLATNNALRALPQTLGPGMPQLRCLGVRANQLTVLPASLGGAPQLTRLLAGANPLDGDIHSFPLAMSLCPMGELYISGCGLTAVPTCLRGYGNTLRWLDVSDNKIETLPEWLVEWHAMRWLDCDYNQISAVSRPVARWLGELNGCSIEGNPIADRPELAGLDGSLVPQALRTMNRKDVEGSDERGIGELERCCWAVNEEVRRERRGFQLTRCTVADGVVFLQLPRSVVVLGYVAILCGVWLMIAWLLPVRTFTQRARYRVGRLGADSSDDSL